MSTPTASKKKPRKLQPMQKGTLVMWNDAKGFGFIRPEGTEDDYFVHISNFKKGLPRRPDIGDELLFRPVESETKKRYISSCENCLNCPLFASKILAEARRSQREH